MLPLLATFHSFREHSFRVTHIYLTLSLRIKANKRQLQSEDVIFESEVNHVWPKN